MGPIMKAVTIALCLISASAEPTVKTGIGNIIGITQAVSENKVEAFLGIPYAKAPIGDLRFALPQPYGKLGENFEAKQFSPKCFQQKPWYMYFTALSEDCLFLNVFRKEGTKKDDLKPVVVIIHGGGFAIGSASEGWYTGNSLAGYEDLVVISMNYRLGVFGFADLDGLAPGNLGLFDQRLALGWVQKYIRDFGGDPNRVTLFGPSAGSIFINTHMITPLNKGKNPLFHSVIMDAGALTHGAVISPQKSLKKFQRVAKLLGCPTGGQELMECARKMDAGQLLGASFDFERSPLLTFQPTADDIVIPKDIDSYTRENAAELSKYRILMGFAKDEGTMFAGYQIYKTHVPEMKDSKAFLAYFNKLSDAYDFPETFQLPEIQENIVKNYYLKTSSPFNDTASILRDTIFACPMNKLAQTIKGHTDVFFFFFERKSTLGFKFLDTEKLGVHHGSPFTQMSGAWLYIYDNGGMSSYMVNAPTEADRSFMRDGLKLVGDFVRSKEVPTFRGLKLPNLGKDEGIIVLNEIPRIRKDLPFEDVCDIFVPKNDQKPAPKQSAGQVEDEKLKDEL